MSNLSFSTDFVQYLFEHRSSGLLAFAKFMSLLGEVEGYVLVVALIYTCFSKDLAYRLAVIALLAMIFNHFLKTLIGNPRPFVADGSYPDKWAVSPENMRELASESSTPSGHAMSISAFYSYLIFNVRSRPLQASAAISILLVGLSRPYLGVHYLEDVLLGWVIGIGFTLVVLRYQANFDELWKSIEGGQQTMIVLTISVAIYLATLWSNDGSADKQPLLFVEYLGFLTGIVAARPLENRLVDFDPRVGGVKAKLLRWLLSMLLIMSTLVVLDQIFGAIAQDRSVMGHALKYLRYATGGFVGFYLAPAIFSKLGMANRAKESDEVKQ